MLSHVTLDDPLQPEDLPGTADTRSFTASVLFARGLDEAMSGKRDDALDDYLAAARLEPNNTLIIYHAAQALMDKGRHAETLTLLEQFVAS